MARYKIDCCKPNCPDRSGDCHGTCERYLTQRAELDATNAEKRRKYEVERNLNGHTDRTIQRFKKRTHSRNRYGGDG